MNKEICRRLYNAYQLDWMARAGVTLQDVVSGIKNHLAEGSADVEAAYAEWLRDEAFSGSCFASYEEFLGTEFRYIGYMRLLSNNSRLISFREYVKALGEIEGCQYIIGHLVSIWENGSETAMECVIRLADEEKKIVWIEPCDYDPWLFTDLVSQCISINDQHSFTIIPVNKGEDGRWDDPDNLVVGGEEE